jgi:hypothetical protein
VQWVFGLINFAVDPAEHRIGTRKCLRLTLRAVIERARSAEKPLQG